MGQLRVVVVTLTLLLLLPSAFAADNLYKLRVGRSVVHAGEPNESVLLTSIVPEALIVDLLGREAVEICKNEITNGWDSCLCRRSDWVTISVQKDGERLVFLYVTWGGSGGNADPFVWNVGRTAESGRERKRVPFPPAPTITPADPPESR